MTIYSTPETIETMYQDLKSMELLQRNNALKDLGPFKNNEEKEEYSAFNQALTNRMINLNNQIESDPALKEISDKLGEIIGKRNNSRGIIPLENNLKDLKEFDLISFTLKASEDLKETKEKLSRIEKRDPEAINPQKEAIMESIKDSANKINDAKLIMRYEQLKSTNPTDNFRSKIKYNTQLAIIAKELELISSVLGNKRQYRVLETQGKILNLAINNVFTATRSVYRSRFS